MAYMVEVTKQDRENANSLIRRFSRTMKESGILREVRAKRFFRESKSKHYKKEAALWRNKIRGLRHDMLKLGELQRGQKIDPERIRKEFQKNG